MLTQIASTTKEGDIIWEPFGGLASASVAAVLLGRKAYTAEIDDTFFPLACGRLEEAQISFEREGILQQWK